MTRCIGSYARIPVSPAQVTGPMLSRNTSRAHGRCPTCGRELAMRANRITYMAQVPAHKAAA